MSITIGITGDEETIAIRAINAFFLGGLILDLMSAFLAFLTSRWLQRLTVAEKLHLEKAFRRQNLLAGRETAAVECSESGQDVERGLSPPNGLACAFFAMSLFVPMPLLVIGVVCMTAGLLTYTWSQHATSVAIPVTVACVSTLPFVAGIFSIGRKERRRKAIIDRLSTMQGDW